MLKQVYRGFPRFLETPLGAVDLISIHSKWVSNHVWLIKELVEHTNKLTLDLFYHW